MDQDSAPHTNGDSYESPYIKELQRNIRSINKKLSLMSKVDSIIAANPGVSLDDLVANRKINNDQKAQALKKPSLQASLTQFEEQITQYKKFDEEYQQRSASEKEQMKAAHSKDLDELRTSMKAEGVTASKQLLREQLLTLSRFLRAAARRRAEEEAEISDETKAFEGVLLLLYGGDNDAVDAAAKLIEDATDGVPSTEGDITSVTYQQINQIALTYAPPPEEDETADAEAPTAEPTEEPTEETSDEAAPATNEETEVESDPTITHAGLTELQDIAQPVTETSPPDENEVTTAPAAAMIGEEAANASAEHWDNKPASEGMDDSWVSVPRDISETEAPATTESKPIESGEATIPLPDSSQNWADDIPASAVLPKGDSATLTQAANDGFHEVVHGKAGRGRGGKPQEQRGGGRGRGGPRVGRGDGNGRGRGGQRGDRGDRGRGRAA